MERVYLETKSCLIRINELLPRFDRANDEQEDQNVKAQLNELVDDKIPKLLDQLDVYVNKEPVSRRYDSKMKADQLKYDYQHLKTSFKNLQYRKDQLRMEAKRREDLLNSASVNSSSPAHVQLFMDHEQNELRHHNRLSRANEELDRMIDHGERTLDDVRLQNDTLKNVRRKILNVANSLGLSNTLIRMIETRSKSDRYVLFGGMFITCLIMIIVIYYWVL